MFGIFDYSKPIIDFENFEFTQIGDALIFGLSILAIGMLTIFAVLCLLWLFLYLFRIVFHDLPSKKNAKKGSVTTVSTVEKAVEKNEADDSEIIAVIAAAIAMAESENSGMKFKVVSFRKV